MNSLLTRTLTGAAFVSVMTLGVLWNIWSYLILFSGIALACLWEFYQLLDKNGKSPQKLAGFMLSLVLLGAAAGKYFFAVNPIPSGLFVSILILVLPLFLIYNLFFKTPVHSLFSPTLFGALYVITPFALLILNYSNLTQWMSENNSRIIFGYLLLIWSNDTFAYLAGISFGKNKLFERISPKKTWEGFAGGMVGALLVSWAIHHFTGILELHHWMIIAILTSIFGTLGDLIESKMKRELDVKDSGRLLPGHGGLLDRFDAVLVSAPFVLAYLNLIS